MTNKLVFFKKSRFTLPFIIITVLLSFFSFVQSSDSATCSAVTLSSSSQNLSLSSGNGTIGVTVTEAGCNWTAKSNDSWIKVLAGFTGNFDIISVSPSLTISPNDTLSVSGNETVNFSVDPNSGAPRSGTITVGDKIFTVTQEGTATTTTTTTTTTTSTTDTSTTTSTTTTSSTTDTSTTTSTTTTTTSTTIPQKITIITESPLPDGKVGVPYNPNNLTTIEVAGGTSPYLWIKTGTLPKGLNLNKSTGVISGTPKSFSKKLTSKVSKFKVTAKEKSKPKNKTAPKLFTITISK